MMRSPCPDTTTLTTTLLPVDCSASICAYTMSEGQSSMPPKAKLNVHNSPRPPLLERTPRRLVVKWNNTVIADTAESYWVLETTHPPSMPLTVMFQRLACFASPRASARQPLQYSKLRVITLSSSLLSTKKSLLLSPLDGDTRQNLFLRVERQGHILEDQALG